MVFVQQIVNAMAQAGVYTLFGVGFALLMGNLRVLNVAHAGVFTMAAILGSFAADATNLAVGFAVAISTGVVLAMAVELVAYAPLRRRSSHGMEGQLAGVLSGLGALFVLEGIARILTGGANVAPSSDALNGGHALFGLRFTVTGGLIAISAAVAVVLVAIFLSRTRMGISIRAVGFAPQVTRDLGVPVGLVSLSAFALAGGLAGLGGMLIGIHTSTVTFTMGLPFLLIGFIVSILGGYGNVVGTAVAAILISILEVFITQLGFGPFRGAIVGGLLLLVLVVKPDGLMGRRESVRA
ncbi:branched-chain amino acid ABC transporter permease [Phytohabitans kaempferiae]|uniref:Branched-chain amino acid ABC transporter permease n=1 Tax=Phytohabitans kaempferiae TaxID=1620943 RepID=A0ABV6M500_9ACTN